MNYLTKLVLSKITPEDLYSFILEDCKIYHSIDTNIGYRTSGSFCFMFKRRQSDSTLISLSVFLTSEGTIQGIISPSPYSPLQSQDDTQVLLKSKHYTSQYISATITDEIFLLTATPRDESVNVRCSSVASSLIITYDKKEKLITTPEKNIFINMATLRHHDSYICHFGGMRTAKGTTDKKRANFVLNSYTLYGKILSVKNEGFKIGGVSFGEWQIFKVRTPFLGNINILFPYSSVNCDMSLSPYGEFKISETTIDSIPLYAESYKETRLDFMKTLNAVFTSKTDYNILKNMIKNDCALYFDGIRIIKGKESVPFVLNELKNYLLDTKITNTIFKGEFKGIYGEKADAIDYISSGKFNSGFYSLMKSISQKCEQNYIKFYNTPDQKLDPDCYKKFIGSEVIIFATTKRKVINSIIFAEKNNDGKISEIHVSSLPIFDIDTIDYRSTSFLISDNEIDFDFSQNVETSYPITAEFLVNFMPYEYQDDMKKQIELLQKNSFNNLNTLVYSTLIYLKNYIDEEQNEPRMNNLSFQLLLNINESIKITKTITTPYYDLFSYMVYFVPEVMYEVGMNFGSYGYNLEKLPTARKIANIIMDRMLKSPEEVPSPFQGNDRLYWALYTMGKFIPRNEELLIKNMTNIALTFLICGICEIQ